MEQTKLKICALIPAYNEALSIGAVINDLKAQTPDIDPIVINDCSADDTESLARQLGARVLDLSINLGIGGAVQTGFRYARDNEYDIAVQFDGDGQHLAGEINSIIQPVIDDSADVVIGSRFLGDEKYAGGFSRRAGIRVLQFANRCLLGTKITDNTSGFRAFNRRAIAFLADNYAQDYPEPVAVVELTQSGFRICEISVKMKPRQHGRSSIGKFGSVYYMIKVLLANMIAAGRKPPQREL